MCLASLRLLLIRRTLFEKRGRGVANIGMLKRDGKVYIQIVKNCSASELIPILSEFSELDESVIYSDCWKAYDGLVDTELKLIIE